MERASRQGQWEGCSVIIYRWVLHLLEASNNLAYTRLPFKAVELLPESDVTHSNNISHITSSSTISNPSKFMKRKGKGKSKSKGMHSHTWKFVTGNGRNLLHLVSSIR